MTEREQFEAWAQKRRLSRDRAGIGYWAEQTNLAWQVWQARAALSTPQPFYIEKSTLQVLQNRIPVGDQRTAIAEYIKAIAKDLGLGDPQPISTTKAAVPIGYILDKIELARLSRGDSGVAIGKFVPGSIAVYLAESEEPK